MQILTTQSVRPTTHCLVYGPAKCGKTRLIPTCPNPIVCSTDEGLSSIREYNIPYVRVTNWQQFLEFKLWVMTNKDAKQFQTVVIDDLTELCELFLIMEKPKHKNLMQAYGQLNDDINIIIRDLRGITDRNCVFICKQERIKDESTGGLIYGPKIPGQAIGPMLPYILGEVYHAEIWVDPTTRIEYPVLRTKRNNYCDAGSRSGKLGELEGMDLGAIFAKVMS